MLPVNSTQKINSLFGHMVLTTESLVADLPEKAAPAAPAAPDMGGMY